MTMYNTKYDRYELELIGGPKDGHIEYVLQPSDTIQYYTGPGRVAIYNRVSEGKFMFDSYKNILKVDAPQQKIKQIEHLTDFDILDDR